jgi:acyl carrier protein
LRAEVHEDLVDFVVSNYLFGQVAKAPQDDDSLIETGIIDSTGILELIEFLESHFGIEVLDSETIPQNLGSVGSLVAFVEAKRNAAGVSRCGE